MEKEYNSKLTYDELILLDKKNIRKKTQRQINDIKLQKSFGFRYPIMNEILFKSLKKGKLTWHYKEMHYCQLCEKENGYKVYKRSSFYHKKGEKNYDKPISFRGIEFNPGFVTIKYHGDICSCCEEKHSIIKSLCKHIIENDLKIELGKNKYYKTKYIRDQCYICFNCKEEIYSSDILKKKCPKCNTQEGNFFMNEYFKEIDKFRMVGVNK